MPKEGVENENGHVWWRAHKERENWGTMCSSINQTRTTQCQDQKWGWVEDDTWSPFLCPYSHILGIWFLLEECQSPWQLHGRSSLLPLQQQLPCLCHHIKGLLILLPCCLINPSSIDLLADQLPACSRADSLRGSEGFVLIFVLTLGSVLS